MLWGRWTHCPREYKYETWSSMLRVEMQADYPVLHKLPLMNLRMNKIEDFMT
jgi:hypothetical protein